MLASPLLAGVVLLWVGLSIAVGTLASRRGRSYGGFLVGSLFFSPVLGLVGLFVPRAWVSWGGASPQQPPEAIHPLLCVVFALAMGYYIYQVLAALPR